MQFTLKEIKQTKAGMEIIGIDFTGKEVKYPYNGQEDIEKINEVCHNCQIIFDGGRVIGAWDKNGVPIYSPKDRTMGFDSHRR